MGSPEHLLLGNNMSSENPANTGSNIFCRPRSQLSRHGISSGDPSSPHQPGPPNPEMMADPKTGNHNKNLVIFDGSAGIRDYLGAAFRGAGYEVHGAADESSMGELLETHSPSLLIIDLIMPVDDGIKTIREVRQRFPDIRIIATSCHHIFLGLARKMGADNAIEKPFQVAELLEIAGARSVP